jgi:hypothetical protein
MDIDDIMLVSNIELCALHNEEVTLISIDNEHTYCNKCDIHVYISIEEWKKNALTQMDAHRNNLNNKIKGLNCIMEIIMNNSEHNPIIKQIEDIVPSLS